MNSKMNSKMFSENDWNARDLQCVWHPCSQMKDHEAYPLLKVVSAKGEIIELDEGKKIIDAISSWWCKSLGHGHPRLKEALIKQMQDFEHVILADTTNEMIVRLSEKLSRLTPSLNKIFYASDGACAVEIAMKMSLHSRQIQGTPHRHRFIALQNSYHGETIGALSVSDVGMYRHPYGALLFDVHFISPLPYVLGKEDKLWDDCGALWMELENQLAPYAETATGVIVEPLIQGASGMKIYSQDLLKRLRAWSRYHGVHLIADEIMTGIGRTGKMLACEHAEIEPDFICLGKGLTSGWLPMSVVLTSQLIYEMFYADDAAAKSFLHSHTYSGNALSASVALETLSVIEEELLCQRAETLGTIMKANMQKIADSTGRLENVRQLGAMVAADLICDDPSRRFGQEVYRKAIPLGALLRPLGNTIYWLPPLNVKLETLADLKTITEQAILLSK